MQTWKIYVNGQHVTSIRTDVDKGAQYVLNKAKNVWPGARIEVVAVL